MTVDGGQANAIFMAVMQQKSLEDAGLPDTEEFQDYYETVAQQLTEAPKGVMPSPVWDYVDDDKYDALQAAVQPALDKAMKDIKDEELRKNAAKSAQASQPDGQPLE